MNFGNQNGENRMLFVLRQLLSRWSWWQLSTAGSRPLSGWEALMWLLFYSPVCTRLNAQFERFKAFELQTDMLVYLNKVRVRATEIFREFYGVLSVISRISSRLSSVHCIHSWTLGLPAGTFKLQPRVLISRRCIFSKLPGFTWIRMLTKSPQHHTAERSL